MRDALDLDRRTRRESLRRAVPCVLAGLALVAFAAGGTSAPARAAGTIHLVTVAADDVDAPPAGSLREAVEVLAGAGDIVRFATRFEVKLAGNLVVGKALAGLRIEGPGGISGAAPKGRPRAAGDGVGRIVVLADGVTVDRVDFSNHFVDVNSPHDQEDAVPVQGVTVSSCTFSGTGGVRFDAVEGGTVSDCTFDVRDVRSFAAVIDLDRTRACRVVRNRVRPTAFLAGLAISAVDGEDDVIEDNVVRANVLVRPVSGAVRRNRVLGARLDVGAAPNGRPGHVDVEANEASKLTVARVDVDVLDNVVRAAATRYTVRKPARSEIPALLAASALRVVAGGAGAASGPVRVLRNEVRGGSVGLAYADVAGLAVDALIEDNDVSGAERTGIHVMSAGPVTVRRNKVTAAGKGHRGIGIDVRSGPGAVALDLNEVTRTRGAGIAIPSNGGAVHMTSNRVTLSTREGVTVGRRSVLAERDVVGSNGRDGISLARGARLRLLDATVRRNRGAGVWVDAGAFADIRRISSSANTGLGIDLAPRGVTPNARKARSNDDAGWPERLVLATATRRVTGRTAPGATIDAYAVESGARAGNPRHGEGATYLGSAQADATGAFVWTAGPCPASGRLTFTATLPGADQGATSEFSPDLVCEDTAGVELISQSPGGAPGDDNSTTAEAFGVNATPASRCIGGQGRWVVFASYAGNLTADAHNAGDLHVYLRDTQTGATTRVTRTHHGGPFDPDFHETNGRVGATPSISEDGRWIAYVTESPEVLAGDEDQAPNVVLFDVQSGATVAVTDAGRYESPALPSGQDTYRGGTDASISGDGSTVAFVSYGRDYVSGDAGVDDDVFVWTRTTGAVERVSVPTGGGDVPGAWGGGGHSPRLSHDGRFVVFSSIQSLVAGLPALGHKVYLRDRQAGTTVLVSVDASGAANIGRGGTVTDNGRIVAFTTAGALVASDTNDVDDVYLRDIQAGTTTRVSLQSDGSQFTGACREPAISAGGRYVAFVTTGQFQVDGGAVQVLINDVYLLDRKTGAVVEVSGGPAGEAYGTSNAPSLSRDGRTLVFQSDAWNLAPGIESGNQVLNVYLRRFGASK